jgi:tRNA A22 N-methylase
MPFTSRQRFLHKKQRRVRKLRQLKKQLSQTQDNAKRQKILEKIRKLSPWDPVLSE